MAFEGNLTNVTLVSSIDWTAAANQYRAVSITSGGEAALAASAVLSVGIMQNSPRSGGEGTVAISGITKGYASEPIVVGNAVGVNATGQITDSGGAPAGAITEIGICVSAAAGAGEICSILLK